MKDEPGRGHLTANVALLSGLGMLGLLSCCSISLNLLDFFGVIDGLSQAAYTSEAERSGGLTAYLCVGAWAVTVALGAPVAAVGLLRRRPWSRVCATVVWGLSAVGCCCTLPFAVYGLWSLSRAEVKALFLPAH